MKKVFTSLIVMLFSAFTLYASSDAEIKAMIEKFSDVEVEIKNDSLYPWVAVGQDSLYNPFSKKATLYVTFESEYVTQLNYENTNAYFYIDDVRISSPKGYYIVPGRYTMKIQSNSKYYVEGLSIKNVCKDSDIKAMIEKFSDVEVEIKNDSLYPWIAVGQDSLYYPFSNQGTLSVTFESEYVTQFNYEEADAIFYIDDIRISKGSYLPSGRHTLKIVGGSKDYVEGLSIKNFCKDSDIKAMIEKFSDVEVEIKNDSLYPWIAVGQDSLYNPSNKQATLYVTFESEYITQLNYENKSTWLDLYLDNNTSKLSKGSYIPSGRHTLRIVGESKYYVEGLSIKNVCKDSDIKAMIEKFSDVEVEIKNDTLYPWIAVGQDSLYNPSNKQATLYVTFESEYITQLNYENESTYLYLYLDNNTSILSKGSYIPSGKHTLKINAHYVRGLSIKNFCKDSDIKAMIEKFSDVEVEVKNDSLYPWIPVGQDSLYQPKSSGKLSITYTSDKAATISYNEGTSNYGHTVTVDGEVIPSTYTSLRVCMCPPGTHVIEIIKATITSLSIKEVVPLVPFHTSFVYPVRNDSYYDVDGDGTYEWIDGSSIYAVDWFDLKSFTWKDYDLGKYEEPLYPNKAWYNLNNDEYLDGVYDDYDYINGDRYDYDSIVFADSNYDFKGYAYNQLYSTIIPLDYNNDGYPDLVSYKDSENNDISFTLENDRVVQNTINALSMREYNEVSIVKQHGGPIGQSRSTALSYDIIAETPFFGNYYSKPLYNIDLNGDGIEDYYDSNKVFTNMGNGIVVYQDMTGDFVELNGDGVMDAISFDGSNVIVYTLNSDGSYTSQSIYSSARYSNFWCYDFDKDNDKDLLLVFSYTKSLGGSFVIMLENLGNGEYNNYEYFYEEFLDFSYCVDFDSDGNYELIARDGSQEDEDGLAPICYLEIEGMYVEETLSYFDVKSVARGSYQGYSYSKHHITDIDNDGLMELSAYQSLMLLSDVVNEKPSQPQSPTFTYESSTGVLSLTWEPATDKESSSVDLTYALRVGTEPGKGDIVYAHAMPDGTRRNCMGGNQGSNRYRLLNTNTWKAGKYYISVQAVDPNNRGSLFSEEVVFEKTSHANAFELSYTMPFGIGDTCTVNLHPNVLLDESHYLTFEDAVVVDKNENGSTYKIVFNEAGDKLISLYSDNENGVATKVSEKRITVDMFSNYEIDEKATVAFDMDEDGYMEYFVIGGVASMSFMSYDANAVASKINKMWNNHENIKTGKESYSLDINKDGKADAITHVATGYSGEQTWSIILNTGNKNMQVTDEYIFLERDHVPNMYRDYNNDGYMDYYSSNGIKANTGNYSDYTHIYLETFGTFDGPIMFRDFTNDGLTDLLVEKYSYVDNYYYYHYIIYENNGDFTFTSSDTIYINKYEKNANQYDHILFFEDLDNDGMLDRVCYVYREDYSKKYHIGWSDGSITYLDGIANIVEHTCADIPLFDFNNDGYLDIGASGGVNDVDGVLQILPNHSYHFVEGVGYAKYNEYPDYSPFVLPDGNLRAVDKIIRSNNTPPSAPTNITAGHSSKGIMISWEHSRDAETPEIRMRYNISVKRKGQTGENAYLISPCNSTKNGVHVPNTIPLIDGNNFFIPTASIPAGEYEVQVQGVDLQCLESDFSEVFELVVGETIAIEAPSTTGVGVETTIRFASNVSDDVDWDGGEVVSSIGNNYIIMWNTPGMKNITAGTHSQAINVVPLPDASFIMPSEVMADAIVNITANNACTGKWSISDDSDTFTDFSDSDVVKLLSSDNDKIVLNFLEEGRYTIRRTIVGEYGDGICEYDVNVTNSITPEILTVTNTDGHYQIMWKHSSVLPENITSVRIYKETSYIDVYDLIHETGLDETSYIDLSSSPDIQSSRYAMSYVTTYGESAKSSPHQGIHVMINIGVGNTWNLAWMKYEGRKINQYRIWRGTSPDDLSVIAEISGNMTSYSDMMTNDDVNYYAVEVVFAEENTRKTAVCSVVSSNNSMSNIVSTASYNQVSFVESIEIQGQDIVANTGNYTQLIAYIQPYHATYKGVNWVIEQGEDIATIDANGVLKANGIANGEVLVRAYALDGSGVYAEKTINVSGFKDTFTVTYIIDGNVVHTQSVKYGNTITAVEAPYKEGYTFNGWENMPATMPAKDITIYGSYTVNYYTLTYMLDNEFYASESVMYGAYITLLPNLTKEGYTFSGWQTNYNTMPAHDVTIYGEFTVNSYNLIYYVDDVEYKRYTLEYGAAITPEEEPVREGYTFSGWSEIPATMPAHDVEVIGSFSINTYQVTYIVEGEVFATDSLTYNSTIVPVEGPEREGYTFSWLDVPATMPAHDITIYGEFTVNSYDLIYYVDDVEYKRYTLEYGVTITPEEEPTKEGYTFSGWSEIPTTMPSHDVEVFGSFSINTYQLTYVVEGEVYATDSLAYNSTIVPIAGPEREGYTFSWLDVPTTMPAHDITIYGEFTVNSYNLIYYVDDVEYKRYTLEYGVTITPEEDPIKEGYDFSGWSEIPATMPAHDVEVFGSFTVGVDEYISNDIDNIHKIFYENQIYIIRDNKVYNIHGMELPDMKDKLGIAE